MTGNIITFVYDILHFKDSIDWMKLVAVPVFLIGGMFAGYFSSKTASRNSLLNLLFVIFCFIASVGFFNLYIHNRFLTLLIKACPFLLVFCMGMQGAFSRLENKVSLGTTIAMTGNMTQFSLDLEGLFMRTIGSLAHVKNEFLLILSFFVGALVGGIGSHYVGFVSVLVPAIIMLYLSCNYGTVEKGQPDQPTTTPIS